MTHETDRMPEACQAIDGVEDAERSTTTRPDEVATSASDGHAATGAADRVATPGAGRHGKRRDQRSRRRGGERVAGVVVPDGAVERLQALAMDRPMPWPAVAETLSIRATPDAFFVAEIPSTIPSGSGEHLWLEIEKVGENSARVGEVLAQALGVRAVDVGVAGRKDRHARTRQWFSLRVPAERTRADLDCAAGDREAADSRLIADLAATVETAFAGRVRIGAAARHSRKLHTGHLEGNRFEVAFEVNALAQSHPLSAAAAGDTAARLRSRADLVRAHGVPNYFGDQRFGQRNLETAVRLLKNPDLRLGRTARSMAISALRAALFNGVLAARVREGFWDRLMPGDWVGLAGSESVFRHLDQVTDASLQARLDMGDVHPTAPLCGRTQGSGRAAQAPDRVVPGEAAALEQRVLEPFAWAIDGLERLGVAASRRVTRS